MCGDIGKRKRATLLPFSCQDQNGLVLRKAPAKGPRSGEILAVIEATGLFFLVEKVAIPVGLVGIGAIRKGNDPGDVGIGMPDAPAILYFGVEAERGILVVERVVVTAREERSECECDTDARFTQPPGQGHDGSLVAGEDLVLDACAVLEQETPARPWLGRERLDPPRAIGMHDIGRVELGGKGERACWRVHPSVKPVDEYEAAGRWCDRGEQQRVVAPGSHAADRTRGKSAESISF